MTHENSAKSLKEQKAKGATRHYRRAVFGLLVAKQIPMTDREVMEALKVTEANNIRPEITRLVQDRLLVEVDKVRCKTTNKTVRRCKALLVPYFDRSNSR